MEAKTNYTIVGITVLVLAAALLLAILWLSVGLDQKTYESYLIYLNEPAAGLSKDAPVKFNGVQVGYVNEISLNKKDPREVQLLLNIEAGTPITTSTTATLISQGITGVTYIGLSASSSDLTPIQKISESPYPIIPTKPSLFNQIDSLLKEVSESARTISIEAQQIFNEENANYIRTILANAEQFTEVIAKNKKAIERSIIHSDIFLKNVAQTSKDFPRIAKELETGIAKFKTMADSLSQAGASVSSTMVSGKSTMDKLSQETLAPASLLLQQLNNIAANIEKASNAIRQNPSVIIRGSTSPKLGPGE